MGSRFYGRSELSAEYYDEILFRGGTFGDIVAAGGPLIEINATDAGFGLQFGEQLRRNDFEGLDLEAVMAGVQHWYKHQQAALTDDQINPSYQLIQGRQLLFKG